MEKVVVLTTEKDETGARLHVTLVEKSILKRTRKTFQRHQKWMQEKTLHLTKLVSMGNCTYSYSWYNCFCHKEKKKNMLKHDRLTRMRNVI